MSFAKKPLIQSMWFPKLKARLIICSLVLCSAYLPLLSGNLFAADAEQQKKFEEVKRSIEKLKAELEKTKSSRDELHQTLEKNEKTIQELNKKSTELNSTLEKKQTHLNKLHSEQDALEKKKSEQVSLVEDYINAAHRLGQQSQLRLLLNQQDPARISRVIKYYKTFSESRSEKIDEFVATIARIQAIEPEIANETANLQRTYAALKEQQKNLKGSQQNRQAILNKLDAEVKTQRQRLSGLEADRQRLEKMLSRVYEEINAQELAFDISEFTQFKGKLPWPTKGKTLNRYGTSRGGSSLNWQGLEIAASRGTKVVAVHRGQVVFSDYLRGHGLLLIIDHGSGYMSLYAHNDNLYKELGEWVEAGESVASVGNTGGRRDTALYFELRYNGKPTNPSAWLRPA